MPSNTPKNIVEDVLTRAMTKEIWSGSYEKILPVTIQDFDLPSILPAVFYMFRFGVRRGKGKFLETFGLQNESIRQSRRIATIESVAEKLLETEYFDGFDCSVEKAILGDLLLAFCLENKNKALGRNEQVQRVAPAHYFSSWIDLPENVVHLRYVPEMVVSMLANQKGEYIQQNTDDYKTWFAVGSGYDRNVLLKAFTQGIVREGLLGDRVSDKFYENSSVGLDQILMIRIAQTIGSPPEKARGGEGDKIVNQHPIADKAARNFSEDLRRFVRRYSSIIPRYSFLELLESCISIGLINIIASVMDILFYWKETGTIKKHNEQIPIEFFIDCSKGINRRLQYLSEQSMDDFMRKVEYFPIILMALRLLDYSVRYHQRLRRLEIEIRPYATEWINLLGEILFERREEAREIFNDFNTKGNKLSELLKNNYPDISEILENDITQPNPVWRLAEALTLLQGRKNTQSKIIDLIDSSLLTNRPNGLAAKRRVVRKDYYDEGTKAKIVRSLIFSDSALDFLVHLFSLPSGNKSGYHLISFKEFLKKIHERYGFCVDVAPKGMEISNELLRENQMILERRLRDLGLLVGVNDAESMKHLRPRFKLEGEDEME